MGIHQTEIYRVHNRAKEISGSYVWKIFLTTMGDRVRFEDGYLKGYMDCKKEMQKKIREIRKAGMSMFDRRI